MMRARGCGWPRADRSDACRGHGGAERSRPLGRRVRHAVAHGGGKRRTVGVAARRVTPERRLRIRSRAGRPAGRRVVRHEPARRTARGGTELSGLDDGRHARWRRGLAGTTASGTARPGRRSDRERRPGDGVGQVDARLRHLGRRRGRGHSGQGRHRSRRRHGHGFEACARDAHDRHADRVGRPRPLRADAARRAGASPSRGGVVRGPRRVGTAIETDADRRVLHVGAPPHPRRRPVRRRSGRSRRAPRR